MDIQGKTKKELISELKELLQENNSLKTALKKNITERSQSEEKFKKASKNWKATFDAIDDIVLLLSPNHEIIEINQAGLDALNKTRGDVLGEKCFHLVHNSDSPIVECPCAISLDNKKVARSEYTVDNKIYELTSWPIFDENKNIKALTHIVKDITVRKKAEAELIKSKEKAEESDRLKSAFLANMSHEIRTPMNGILGFSELLKEPGLTGEKQQEYIRIIEKSGDRMLNIINDIVSISKIEAGIMDIHLSKMNINNQMQFVYDLLRLDADKKKLSLSFNCILSDKKAIELGT